MAVELRAAADAPDYALVRELIAEYLSSLPFEVDFQDTHTELADPAALYGTHDAVALLAFVDGAPAGLVALSRFDERSCEMKRLFVRPDHRGLGFGRRLAEEVVAVARRLGYERMLLDTVRELAAANALYESLGFRDVPAYRHNPRPDARYLALELGA